MNGRGKSRLPTGILFPDCPVRGESLYRLTIVSYLDMLQINWRIVSPDDVDVIATTCSRDRNCTVVYTACAYGGFVNKTCVGLFRE